MVIVGHEKNISQRIGGFTWEGESDPPTSPYCYEIVPLRRFQNFLRGSVSKKSI